MDRREILNELQQIVAVSIGRGDRCLQEAAQRAKGLIREVESLPIAFPPAPFVSDQCCERHHGDCQNGPKGFIRTPCNCACHCPPEAPQQHREEGTMIDEARHQPTLRAEAPQQPAAERLSGIPPDWSNRSALCKAWDVVTHRGCQDLNCKCPCGHPQWRDIRLQPPAEAPQQPAEPAPPAARHIDTPDELLELLAGISSDPQIEGLSLSQKASTMAMLYVAKALQQIKCAILRSEDALSTERGRQREHRATIENQAELAAKALQQIAGDVKCLNENTQEGFDTVCIAIEPLGESLQEIADQLGDIFTVLEMVGDAWLAKAVQSPDSPQEPS